MQAFSKYGKLLPWFMALLLGASIAACGDGETPEVPGERNGTAILASVAITPATATLPMSAVQPLVATATYSDGSTLDVTALTVWSSSNVAVGAVAPTTGVLTSLASGVAVITGSIGGKTASATVTVTTVSLVSVAIVPAAGPVPISGLQVLVATATYSDGSTRNVTPYSAWASTTPGVATVVAATGVVTGVATGASVVTASFLGKTSSTPIMVGATALTSLTVTPNTAVVHIGATQALLAKATFSDGTVVDVTAISVWTSNTPLAARMTAQPGVVTGVAVGAAVVTAAYAGKSATAGVTVPALTLLSINVTPASVTLQAGDLRAFVATGNFSDGSTANLSSSAAWSSGNLAVATVVANTGVATGLAAGSTVVTATANGKSASATLTVSAAAGRAAVNLGSAGNFVALAKTGISTTGLTAIVGDIGVSPAAASFITGFGLIADATNVFASSSLVTGKVYASNYAVPSPGNMTTAIADMQTAFTDAAGRTLPDFTELGAGNISGLTLAPGLYKWGTGVLVTSTGVTLSGGPNDVWIFQVAQDLTISNSAMVTLAGGAQAKNVFWQVSGKATLGTAANFKGNLMSQTLISLGTGAVVTGRLMAQTAITLDAARLTAP